MRRLTKVFLFIYLLVPLLILIDHITFIKIQPYSTIILWYLFPLIIFYYRKILGKRLTKDPFLALRPPFRFIRQKNFSNDYNPPLKAIKGVEIGVFEGDHANALLSGLLNIEKLYLIDPYIPYEEGDMSAESQDGRYNRVKNMFKDNSKVELLRQKSTDAAKKFDKESLDFVYLDGNHSYEYVLNDLEMWYPKLKLHGVLCGDDFGHPSGDGIVKAVNEFAYRKKVLVFSEGTQFWFVKTTE